MQIWSLRQVLYVGAYRKFKSQIDSPGMFPGNGFSDINIKIQASIPGERSRGSFNSASGLVSLFLT